MTPARNYLAWLWLSVAIIVVDQWSKWLVSSKMYLSESIPLIPNFFHFTRAHNYGAAFSFLHDAGGWQRWLFAGIAIAVSVGMLIWLRRLPQHARFLACAITLLLGGAIGNLYDRIVLGYVVDFLHVFYGNWHFPAFNIADCAISIGAAMLVIDALFLEKRREALNQVGEQA